MKSQSENQSFTLQDYTIHISQPIGGVTSNVFMATDEYYDEPKAAKLVQTFADDEIFADFDSIQLIKN